MPDYQYLKVESQDRVGVLTIDRPPVNALSRPLLEEISAMLDAVIANPQIKALVVTGAGEKVFAAGADIKVFAQVETVPDALEDVQNYIKLAQDVFLKLDRLALPTIAAINGTCLGGGLELALACDMRYAAEHASLGAPEINLGLIPGWGGTQRLPRIVGHSHALELILTGEPISAAQALQMGLVSQVVPGTQLLNAALDLGHKIARRSRIAITAALRAVTDGIEMPFEQGLALERQQFATTIRSEDAREGLAAFLAKRQPDFQDR